MTEEQGHRESDNPFSTRWTRPGTIPFHYPPDVDADRLVEKLRELAWRGQIIGHHGAGKSTLLADLLPRLAKAGRAPMLVELHQGQRRVPADIDAELREPDRGDETLVVVDGYEQLGRIAQWQLKRHCRRRGWGLLITCHADAGLPTLIHLEPNLKAAVEVVKTVLGKVTGDIDENFIRQHVADSFHSNAHDMRETLFDLYDRYDRQTSPEVPPSREARSSQQSA